MTANPITLLDTSVREEKQKKDRLAWAARLAIFCFSFFLTVLMLMVEEEPTIHQHEFAVGEPAPRTLFSPFSLTYVDEKATEALKQQKSQEVPLAFVADANVSFHIHEKVEHLFAFLHGAKQTQVKDFKLLKQKVPLEISESALKLLWEGSNLEEVRKHIEWLLEQNLTREILDDQKKQELLEKGMIQILIVHPGTKSEKMVPVREILTLSDLREPVEQSVKQMIPKKPSLRDAVLEIFNAVIRPNVTFSDIETKAHQQKARESVPSIEQQIKRDELIVQRGMLVSSETKLRIDLIQKELAKKKVLNKLLALGLLVLLTYFLGFLYLLVFERKTLLSFRQLCLIHTIFLLTLLLCKVISIWPDSSFLLMPVALAPLLLTLLVGPRIGIFSSAVMGVLSAPLAGFSADVILATLLASAAGVFAAVRVRKRVQFLKVGLAIGATYFLVLFAFQIFQEFPVREAFLLSLQGFASGFLITTPLAFLLLPVFEWCFNLTTDITLLELSDLNHPLLKRMVVEAPGTYHHSLVVSTLAEGACEAIGANALLARVGAYFHDIGKIARAQYFTENQPSQAANRHEKLTPTMSCLLIMNHVKDGLELGRRYKLKERILQFIPEHQGTGVIYFFYKKALDEARPGERIRVEDFRYPGPKPQSKETAVVLLSDSTEAASRSLKDPSPESIRQLVRKIINDKFIDGQLDECDLTLRDLHKIQESFMHNLMAIFHTRVRYPVIPETPDRPNLFEEEQFSKFRVNS